jgi:sec-independent protein translocase protein TatC
VALESDQERMTVIEHLDELRRRILVALAALLIAIVIAFVEYHRIFQIIKRPLQATGVKELVTFSPSEPFMTVLKVSVYAGMMLALPVILYEFWAFMMPALYERERKAVIPYVLLTTGLFIGGVVFCYYLVLPVGLHWLIGFGGDIFNQQLRAGEYVGFVTLFLLAFGVTFELPIVLLILDSIGVVNHRMLKRYRRYAIVIIAVVAMVLTPSQDPVSMILMMAPLLLLYEFSLVMTRLAERRRARRRALAVE